MYLGSKVSDLGARLMMKCEQKQKCFCSVYKKIKKQGRAVKLGGNAGGGVAVAQSTATPASLRGLGWNREECTNHAAALPSPAILPFVCAWRSNWKNPMRFLFLPQIQVAAAPGRIIFIFISGRKSRSFPLHFLITSSSLWREFCSVWSKPGRRIPWKTIAGVHCLLPLSLSPKLSSCHHSSDLNDVSFPYTLPLLLFAPFIFWERINSTRISTGLNVPHSRQIYSQLQFHFSAEQKEKKIPTLAESHNCHSALLKSSNSQLVPSANPSSALGVMIFRIRDVWASPMLIKGPCVMSRPPQVQFPVLLTADHCQGRLQQVTVWLGKWPKWCCWSLIFLFYFLLDEKVNFLCGWRTTFTFGYCRFDIIKQVWAGCARVLTCTHVTEMIKMTFVSLPGLNTPENTAGSSYEHSRK